MFKLLIGNFWEGIIKFRNTKFILDHPNLHIIHWDSEFKAWGVYHPAFKLHSNTSQESNFHCLDLNPGHLVNAKTDLGQ